LGNTYKDINDFQKTEEYYQKTLEIDLETGNKNGIANSYSNLATLKNQMADSLQGNMSSKRQHLMEAVNYAKKSLEIAKEIEAYPIINDASEALMLANKKLGNTSEAFKYAEIYISSRDTMFSAEKTSAIANAEKMFEAEKKQLQIDKLNKERQLQQAQIKQQRYINWSVIVGIIMITIFSIIIVGRLRITRKQKRIIENQKIEVDGKNTLLEQQNEEIKTQNEIVTKQKERIEEQQQKIADSINYALKIQKAVLPSNQYAQKVLNNHFILFMPHSTVSGDFYWITRVGQWSITAVADCTGHGVPGAFMSMLGVSFLNEIVRKNEIYQPAEILNELRKYVISALKQTAAVDESLMNNELYGGQLKDGMDISILAINKDEKKAMWAGAYNPLWLIRNSTNKDVQEAVKEVVEYKADKMPVAIHVIMEPFTNHEFELHEGDKFYMFSDGFPDQFGGPKAKKFMRKRFKKLIAESAHLSMEDQGIKLQEVFNEWIKNNGDTHDQVDDVTVMGIEI
jgi:serine phosphatase RsbU (regulator of sigma subunit)